MNEEKEVQSVWGNQWPLRTTCHGISDLFLAKTKTEKLFWIICLILSFCFVGPSFLYMVNTYTQQNEWISTAYEEEMDEIYLPKVALCNYNRLNRTKAFSKYHLNATHLLYINRQFFQTAYVFNKTLGNVNRDEERKQYVEWKSSLHGNNITFEDLLNDLAPTCESTIHFLVYNDIVINKPCELVKQVSSVFFGRCLWLEIPKSYGPITIPGQLEGLKMILSSNLKDYDSGIVQRFLHHGLAMYLFYEAHPDHWISLTPGLHHMISIKAESHVMNTNSFTYFKFLQSKEKRCLQDKKFLVKDKKKKVKSSKMACHIDCQLFTVVSYCNCVPVSASVNYSTCEPDFMEACLNNLANNLNVTVDKVVKVASSRCIKNCKRHCVGMHVKYEISSSHLLADTKILELHKWLAADGNQISGDDHFRDFIGVNIFYESLSIFTVEWREHMAIEQLISNIGGLLGLCAGISLLTIVQALIYFFISLKNAVVILYKQNSKKVGDPECEKNSKKSSEDTAGDVRNQNN